MKLKRFLEVEGKRPYRFAQEAGVPKNTVYYIARHGHAPLGATLATLMGISAATGGEVRLEDMMPPVNPPDWVKP
jgi:hypothetical protein